MEEENKIIEEKKGNGSKVIIILLTIIIVLLIGLVIAVMLKPNIFSFTATNSEKSKSSTQNVIDNKKDAIKQEEPEATTKEGESENTTTETTETPKSDRLVKIGDVTVNLSNCKNCNENEEYSSPVIPTSQNNGLSLSKKDDKTLVLTIDYSKYGKLCDNLGCKHAENEVKKYEIINYSKITKYIVGGRGQDFTSTKIIYLDEMGSANVINVYNESKDDKGHITYTFNNEPKTKQVLGHDMIALFNTTVNTKGAFVGSYVTTIGVLEDGSFYDLGLWLDRNEQLNN